MIQVCLDPEMIFNGSMAGWLGRWTLSPCKGIRSPSSSNVNKTTNNAWTKTVETLCMLFESTYKRNSQMGKMCQNLDYLRILALYSDLQNSTCKYSYRP
jgi:hypothetical protein